MRIMPIIAMLSVPRLAGTVVGLVLEQSTVDSSWLLPFTAGCFLYVALVSLGPDLIASKPGSSPVVDVAMMLLGIALVAVLRE
jgi:zinc transporter ZupT